MKLKDIIKNPRAVLPRRYTDFGDTVHSFVSRGTMMEIKLPTGETRNFLVDSSDANMVVGYFQTLGTDKLEKIKTVLNTEQIASFKLL